MKKTSKKARSKQYMNYEAFSKLELSLNQALAHARGEQGDFKEKKVAAPFTERR